MFGCSQNFWGHKWKPHYRVEANSEVRAFFGDHLKEWRCKCGAVRENTGGEIDYDYD
jgi:hypothetical protein